MGTKILLNHISTLKVACYEMNAHNGCVIPLVSRILVKQLSTDGSGRPATTFMKEIKAKTKKLVL